MIISNGEIFIVKGFYKRLSDKITTYVFTRAKKSKMGADIFHTVTLSVSQTHTRRHEKTNSDIRTWIITNWLAFTPTYQIGTPNNIVEVYNYFVNPDGIDIEFKEAVKGKTNDNS